MNKLTVGSLFSGIGGIELGLERTGGFETTWQVEIDDYAQKVLAKHWPDVARYGDIRTVGKHNLQPVDLICGGFPCQPHSLAGKRKASEDERDLWSEYHRIICELKPSWVVAENVPGLLSSEDGRFFGRILRDLAQVGYDAEWQIISAASVGAPHIRERIIILANANSECCRASRPSKIQARSAIETSPTSEQSAILAYPCSSGRWTGQVSDHEWSETSHRSLEMAYTSSEGLQGSRHQRQLRNAPFISPAIFKRGSGTRPKRSDWWTAEPNVGRVAHGVPSRVDRLKCLGNAVVPQVAQYVGECILAAIQNEQEVPA